MRLKPFFTYYGGKWRAALKYPKPLFDTIVEPFAGGAGYALRYAEKNVVLVEKSPSVAALWRYLITTPAAEIRQLPLIKTDGSQTVADLSVSPEATTLIGFWLNKGVAAPCKQPSAWMRSGKYANCFWGAHVRERIASQVDVIRHWRVVEGPYSAAPSIEASWFVDPPYQHAGKHYPESSAKIDYASLSYWCRQLKGQVIVCENEGANWLPFQSFMTIKAMEGRGRKRRSQEVIWTG